MLFIRVGREDLALHGSLGRFVREEGRVAVVGEFVVDGLYSGHLVNIRDTPLRGQEGMYVKLTVKREGFLTCGPQTRTSFLSNAQGPLRDCRVNPAVTQRGAS